MLSINSAWGANFIRISEYGNEIETTTIKRVGEFSYYVIRKYQKDLPANGVNVIANYATRQRAERNNPPGISANNEQFVDVYPATPNAAELFFVCSNQSSGDSPAIVSDQSKPQKLAAMEAELALLTAQHNAIQWGPHRIYINASSSSDIAAYYTQTKQKIEKIGTMNFPKIDGRAIYGNVVVSIPIFQDGTIYENEGGPRIEKSSGIDTLDKAALHIVRQAAPFEKFPERMRSPGKDTLWIMSTSFTFDGTDDGDLSIVAPEREGVQ